MPAVKPIGMKDKLGAGFSVIEYAALVAITAAALLGMAVYLKRAVSGNWRKCGDVFGQGRQYHPGITEAGE